MNTDKKSVNIADVVAAAFQQGSTETTNRDPDNEKTPAPNPGKLQFDFFLFTNDTMLVNLRAK